MTDQRNVFVASEPHPGKPVWVNPDQVLKVHNIQEDTQRIVLRDEEDVYVEDEFSKVVSVLGDE